ncbi:hypothetical protein N7490_004457 [Penicillium lividum]|nr:hypothetical protein N7490_004457 [Penicillium lividum]
MGSISEFDLDNIQGDIWPGLSKRYEKFIFFTIQNPALFKPGLQKLADEEITSSNKALLDRVAIQKVNEAKKADCKKTQSGSGLLGVAGGFINLGVEMLTALHDALPEHGHIPRAKGSDDASIAGVNISFSNRGMAKLSSEKFKDDPFIKGMFHDMVNEGRDEAHQWIPEFTQNHVDGVVLVCGTQDAVEKKRVDLLHNYLSKSKGVVVVKELEGKERPGKLKGHEHFGFLDGISQPLIKGLDDETAKLRGSRKELTRPGIILFGHDGEMDDNPDLKHPAWAKDGSILVVRKIKQLVPEWNKFIESEAPKLNFTPGQFGARLVGRWQSGAPVEKYPNEDPVAKYADDDPEKKIIATWNDFDYPTDNQFNCPFASHMRKTKPRSVVGNEDKFDIMRRGIPYGEELRNDEATETKLDRGLMFLCYQTSLSNGFQFIRNRWINPDTFPFGKTEFTGGINPGQDALVGQSVKGAIEDDDKILSTSIYDGNGQHNQVNFMPFIESHGGDYFFTPSLKLLRELSVAPAV